MTAARHVAWRCAADRALEADVGDDLAPVLWWAVDPWREAATHPDGAEPVVRRIRSHAPLRFSTTCPREESPVPIRLPLVHVLTVALGGAVGAS